MPLARVSGCSVLLNGVKTHKFNLKRFSEMCRLLGYIGLLSLIILWISGIILSINLYGGFIINSSFTIKIIAAGILLGLSSFVNFHVYNSSKNNLPPNKTIMKVATMSGRGLLVIVLISAAIAFY